MSLGTHEYGDAKKRQAQYNAAVWGGAKGGALGASVAIQTAYILHQRWVPFRHLTLPLKAFFVTTATIASAVIAADKSGIAFDKDHYTDEGAEKMRQFKSKADRDWSELSARDKGLTWAKENKFGVVAGSWVASMGGIFYYIHRTAMPFTQQIAQVRVWAQGITLVSLVGMAAISTIPSAGDKILEEREHASDHSWRDFVGDENADPAKGGSSRNAQGQEKPTLKSSGLGPTSQSKDDKSEGKSGGTLSDKSTGSKGSYPLQSSKKQQGNSASEDSHAEKSSNNKSSEDSQSKNETDPSGKSSRSASPTAPKQKAQTTKAPSSQTGANAGYSGNN